MAVYEITAPDGAVFEVEAPDDATEEQVMTFAQQQMAGTQMGQYQEGRAEGNPVIRGLSNVIQGPTFGFGDELVGAIGGAYKTLTQPDLTLSDLVTGKQRKSFSENYRDTRDYMRGVQDKYQEDFPIGSIATQFMTAAPTLAVNPLGAGANRTIAAVSPKAAAWLNPATKLTGPVANATRAAVSGAGYGAVSGAGESRAEDLSGIAGDAGMGAAKGALISGVMQPVQSILGAAGRNVTQRVSDSSAGNYAQQKVAQALARDAKGSIYSSGAVNPSGQVSARFGKLGPEATVADAGGENTRQLLDTLATLPGKTKDRAATMIRDRQAGRAGRLVSAADDALGTRGAGFTQTIEALDSARRQAAAPYYRELEGLATQVDDDVLKLLGRTMGIHGEAQKLYRLQTGEDVVLGTLKKGDQVPFAVLDTLKQSLYDAAESAKRQGNNKMARAIDDVRVQLTGKLDAVAPKVDGQSVYKLARDAYAGPSQLIDAAEMGRTAMRADAFDVASNLKGMSQSEIEAFRVGALQALREKSGTQSGQTSLLKMWMEPSTRDRLKAIFGKDYRTFSAEVAKEARLKGLETVGRGSQTASRMYGAGDLDVGPILDTANLATSAARGSPTGMLAGASNLWNRVRTPESVRDAMGRILLSQGQEGASNLNAMGGLLGRINAESAAMAERSGAFYGLLGSQAPIGGLLGP
ncbi:hypothetical protein [Hydrogenophaga sp. PML113]|uniref:hypothetical protein n=1 Tax=Hydrogenophaga sp. PML113 TaxID=1899350 RepID=UPI000878F8C6|nr:hypothetical protein [Hydrogenophaga sp. PML113]